MAISCTMLLPLSPIEDVERDSARRELRDRLVGGLVGPRLDLAVELLPEPLEQPRVDVVGVVVNTVSVPPSGATPSASIGLSSVTAHSTLLSLRGNGSPPGPTGFATTRLDARPPAFPPALAPSPLPPASVPVSSQKPIGVVVFWHATSAPATPVPAAAAAAPRRS